MVLLTSVRELANRLEVLLAALAQSVGGVDVGLTDGDDMDQTNNCRGNRA